MRLSGSNILSIAIILAVVSAVARGGFVFLGDSVVWKAEKAREDTSFAAAEFVDGGVLIRESKGIYSKLRLKPGDLIHNVNGVEVVDTSAFLKGFRKETPVVKLRVIRNDLDVVIQVDREDLSDFMKPAPPGVEIRS